MVIASVHRIKSQRMNQELKKHYKLVGSDFLAIPLDPLRVFGRCLFKLQEVVSVMANANHSFKHWIPDFFTFACYVSRSTASRMTVSKKVLYVAA